MSGLTTPKLPPGGRSVFPCGQRTTLRLVGLPDERLLLFRDDAKGEAGIEVRVSEQGDTPWAFLLASEIDAPVAAGDAVHVRFRARSVESMTGASRIAVVVEDSSGTQQAKFVDLPITVGSDWEWVDVPCIAQRDCAPLEWKFSIRLGYAPQVLRIADLQVLNFGTRTALSELPRPRTGYDGREDDAPWRQEALDRIEAIRTGSAEFLVVDRNGQPLPNVDVCLTLRRHAFAFGTCISTRLLEESPDGERYRSMIPELFSSAVIENELKWPPIIRNGYATPDRLIGWLNEKGIPTRGHCLVWPSKRFLPEQVVALADDKQAFAATILEHITRTVERYRGKLVDWDVINEPYAHRFAMEVLGEEAMVDWFNAAHAADPKARLFINDYEILESGDRIGTSHQNHFFETARFLLDRGAPLHGVGIQGHFGSNITSPGKMMQILDRFASLGVRIQVTELDVIMGDEAIQTDFYRDALITLFSHPAVDGITQWGFWEGSHWIPAAALYGKDWSLRPHGQVFLDLVHRRWKTQLSLHTGNGGRVGFRGYLGEYDAVITVDGVAHTHKFSLSRETAPIRFQLL